MRAEQINFVIGVYLTPLRDLDLTMELCYKHIFNHQADFTEPLDRTTILL